MPVPEVSGTPPRITVHPAFPGVAPGREIPSLPPWLLSVAEIPGEVAAAQIDPRRLADLAAHLLRERIGYYWPLERVRRRGPKGWKAWDRSLFPGTLFCDIGRYDDRASLNAAQDYCRFIGRRLGLVRASNGAAQSRFKRELASLEILLGHDPTLSARNRIDAGRRVRVTAGAFVGAEGVVIGDGPRATLQVGVETLGRSVAVEVAREMLELI